MTDGEVYESPPLAVVALEVRYPELAEGLPRTAPTALRTELRQLLPITENVTRENVTIDAGSAPVVQRRTFPRYTTRDRTVSVVVQDALFVLETTSYDGFDRFSPLAERVVTAVAAALQPDAVTRVGLRYVDEVRVPSITALPGDWSGYIDGHLLAAVDPGFLPENITARTWQGLVQYSTGTNSALVLRYGPADGYAFDAHGPTRRKNPPAAGPYFLLDLDSFWLPSDDMPEFDPAEIMSTIQALHRPTRAMFRAVCTEQLRTNVFKPLGAGK